MLVFPPTESQKPNHFGVECLHETQDFQGRVCHTIDVIYHSIRSIFGEQERANIIFFLCMSVCRHVWPICHNGECRFKICEPSIFRIYFRIYVVECAAHCHNVLHRFKFSIFRACVLGLSRSPKMHSIHILVFFHLSDIATSTTNQHDH